MLTQSSIYKEYLDLMDTEAYIYIYIGRFNHKQCKIVKLLSAFGFRLRQSI